MALSAEGGGDRRRRGAVGVGGAGARSPAGGGDPAGCVALPPRLAPRHSSPPAASTARNASARSRNATANPPGRASARPAITLQETHPNHECRRRAHAHDQPPDLPPSTALPTPIPSQRSAIHEPRTLAWPLVTSRWYQPTPTSLMSRSSTLANRCAGRCRNVSTVTDGPIGRSTAIQSLTSVQPTASIWTTSLTLSRRAASAWIFRTSARRWPQALVGTKPVPPRRRARSPAQRHSTTG